MAGASSDGEVNHWPAVVDVLTTVIMVVTFMLVIMSAAIMTLSQRVIKQIEAKAAAQTAQLLGDKAAKDHGKTGANPLIRSPQDAPDGSAVADKGDILRMETPPDGAERLSIRTRETPDTLKLAIKAVEAPKAQKGAEVKTADTLVKVAFEANAYNYDEDSTGKVVAFLRAHPAAGVSYEIWSFAPQTGSVSEAQRVAFYRAAMTRNLLVKAGIAPKQITTQVRITDPKLPDGHMVRLVVKP
jgi:outer membrane protein OmpA-like peptidoglycan-associated protein